MYPAGITIIAAVKYPVKRKGNAIRSREGRPYDILPKKQDKYADEQSVHQQEFERV